MSTAVSGNDPSYRSDHGQRRVATDVAGRPSFEPSAAASRTAGVLPDVAARLSRHVAAGANAAWHVQWTTRLDVLSCGVDSHVGR